MTRRSVYLWILTVVCLLLALTMVIVPLVEDTLLPAPEVGQVTTRDYRALRTVTYVSQIRTDQRRSNAEQSVLPFYTAADTRVARRQMEQLRSALAYITSVRADSFAKAEQKASDLAALEEVRLSQPAIRTVLALTDARWLDVQQGALSVLERIMSSAIRPEAVNDARDRTPSMVSLSFSEEQAALITELASAFVAANSQYSESLTLEARNRAREATEPATRTFIAGQTVVMQGEVLDTEDIEALYELDLVQVARSWPELASAGLMTLLMTAFVVFYAHRKQVVLASAPRKVAIMAILLVLFLTVSRAVATTHVMAPYLFPLAAYALVATALFNMELALVTALPLSILAAYGLPNAPELTLYFILTSAFGVLTLGRARRLLAFLFAGIAISVAGLGVVFVYHMPTSANEIATLITLIAAALICGLTSASSAILLHSMLAQFLGMVTPMQLIELTRPDHPLLRRLLRDAPGTYQHSLQVANLAEQAAERIGADALLTRVGALYHDIGKTLRPVYYIENQPPGFANPHDGLSPERSANMILSHVLDSLALGRQFHLPPRLLDFMSEHHGTGLARYQYNKAVQAAGGDAGKVNEADFRYPGPRPQSRETAILMLADSSEARVRAERPQTDDAMRFAIKAVITDRVESGELDDTRLTLNDLQQIADSFFATLRGFYHPRLDYSRVEKATETARLEAAAAAAQPDPTPATAPEAPASGADDYPVPTPEL